MAKAIDKIGVIVHEADSDIFSSVIHHIIAQQISTKAQDSIWRRFCARFVPLDAHTIAMAQVDELRECGISERKARYILDFAFKVQSGAFDLEALAQKSDDNAIEELTKLKGIGRR